MSVNKVILLGRLGQDPELKYTPSGAAVCNFSIATSEFWADKNSGERQERTEWHKMVAWGKTAETIGKYMSKGKQIYVEGRLQTRSWDDKDGNKRYTTEIVVSSMQFVDSKGDSAGNLSSTTTPAQAAVPAAAPIAQEMKVANDTNFTADDIPF